MTISGERTERLDIIAGFCRVTGFTSDFLSFIVVEQVFFRFYLSPTRETYTIKLVLAGPWIFFGTLGSDSQTLRWIDAAGAKHRVGNITGLAGLANAKNQFTAAPPSASQRRQN